MGEPHVVTLRATRAGDLDELSLTPPDLTGSRTIRADGVPVGWVAASDDGDVPVVTCCVDPAYRGRGIGTRALRLLLDGLSRPVRARASAGDAAAPAMLARLGFVATGDEGEGGDVRYELA
ncbi:GNAT family N-acetyltransferase [Agromyces sp. G08B096]|uniref:GNAT family N-acetyltransferase n=1 Tax=Agromyces sp. G08B096 TaxID=3156399 RepID=A0AAU7W324_9MICO